MSIDARIRVVEGLVGIATGDWALTLVVGWALSTEIGRWRAVSKTAQAITGDVEVGRAKLTINFANFSDRSRSARLKPAELSAAFTAEDDPNASGSLYRLNVPGPQ